jgi:hypothetical protein
LAYVGRELAGLPGLFWGVAAGNVLSGAAGFLWYRRNRRKQALHVEYGAATAQQGAGAGAAGQAGEAGGRGEVAPAANEDEAEARA